MQTNNTKLKRLWSIFQPKNGKTESAIIAEPQSTNDSDAGSSSARVLPVLQIWPSNEDYWDTNVQDGHKKQVENIELTELSDLKAATSSCSLIALHDSGIESSQVSPLIIGKSQSRKSSVFLHPNRANVTELRRSLSSESVPIDDNLTLYSSPSISSTQDTINFDNIIREATYEKQRRSSSIAQYYLSDNSDMMEYAILKAAARGSFGQRSLSECSQKLTFTQTLAFPELAKNVGQKRFYRKYSQLNQTFNPNSNNRLNHFNFAKLFTSCILVLTSILVFVVVYRFVKT